MISPRSALKGVAAALVAPWHLEGERLERLLEPSAGGAYRASDGAAHPALEDGTDRAAEDAAHHASDGAAARRRESADCRAAVRWANRALRILARLPASPWRNTCLYRATAGCLALRWLGEPASLVIGARRDSRSGEIQAHAWIEAPALGPAPDDGYRPLARPAALRATRQPTLLR